MAGGEVGLGLRCGALGTDSITHALVSALRLLSTLLITTLVSAPSSTTRTLAGTGGTECSVHWTIIRNENLSSTVTALTFVLKHKNVIQTKAE